ncbi:DER1-domain-containing protein [Fistulina hepatica ATCC 64428]|uniref:Derlin n=1 Tax=Fistulina hepatica ATCC 64428 TaxID=1128425 RepID=A0A0D7A590_9AGAR|nr:DER1-domain-containing protein [Fistulina hepatica ATCC 64428]
MDGFLAEIKKIPPITRTLCFSSLGVTVPVLMNLVSAYKVLYVPRLVWGRLELWRLYTSFFLGGGGFNFIFEIAMLYRTSEQLETGPYAGRPADLAWQLFWAAGALVAASTPMSTYVFTRPFLLCLIYISSRLAPLGAQTSLMGLVTFPVTYLPFAMLGMDFLMGGPTAAAQSLAGAIVGHMWWWGVWGTVAGASGGVLAGLGRAPAFLRNLLGQGSVQQGAANAGAAGGVHVIPPRVVQATASTSGHNWGAGQRLGS